MVFKLHVLAGLLLVLAGILLDYTFVEAAVSDAFKTDPLPLLHSWRHRLHDLSVSYMVTLGFLQIALAVLLPNARSTPGRAWSILSLTTLGSALIIATGFRYAAAGPSFHWEPRCTALTIGLGAVALGLILEAHAILATPSRTR